MAEETDSEVLLDKKIALEHVQNDEEFLKEIYQIFLDEIPGRIESFKDAFSRQDAEKLVSVSHSLKGVSLTIGARSCNQLAENVEMAARAEDMERAETLYGKLEKVLLQLQAKLSEMDLS